MFNVGIVGCGVASREHLRTYKSLSEVNLRAVCDSNVRLAEEVSHRWHIPAYYSDFTSMLQNEDLNLLSVCIPYNVRTQVVEPAVEKGIHILVEKPFAMTVNEADKMLEAGRKNGASICCVHNMLYLPVVRRITSLIREGKIGNLVSADIGFVSDGSDWISMDKNHWCHSLPGGRFGEGMPHAIYLALALASPLKIEGIFASKLGSRPWLNPDELRVVFRSSDGRLISLYQSLNSNRWDIYVNIYGTEAQIRAKLVNSTMTVVRNRKSYSIVSTVLDELSCSSASLLSYPLNLLSGLRSGWPYELIIRSFVKSILEKTEPPVSVESMRQTVELCETICTQLEYMRQQHYDS